jgi:hypothetical protein
VLRFLFWLAVTQCVYEAYAFVAFYVQVNIPIVFPQAYSPLDKLLTLLMLFFRAKLGVANRQELFQRFLMRGTTCRAVGSTPLPDVIS